jgi:hypothetical protein
MMKIMTYTNRGGIGQEWKQEEVARSKDEITIILHQVLEKAEDREETVSIQVPDVMTIFQFVASLWSRAKRMANSSPRAKKVSYQVL